MTVESGSYISALNATYPTGAETNDIAEGDDHIRFIKAKILETFPAITGAVTASHTELNAVAGLTASAAELNVLDGITASTTELNYCDGVTSNIQTQLNTKATTMPTISAKTDSFTAVAGNYYVMQSGASKTATLPASPSAGNQVWLTNNSGNSWTVGRNSSNIMGAASDDTLTNGSSAQYIYIDSTTGWARMKYVA